MIKYKVLYIVKGETQTRHSDHSSLKLAVKKHAKLIADSRVEKVLIVAQQRPLIDESLTDVPTLDFTNREN